MKTFKTYVTETIGQAGLDYELKVHKAMITANIDGLNAGDKPGAGFSNQGAGDIEASYNGKQYREDYTQTPDYLFIASMIEYKFNSRNNSYYIAKRYNCIDDIFIEKEKRIKLFINSNRLTKNKTLKNR